MISRDALAKTLIAVLETGATRATKYLSPKEVVSAQRRVFRRGRRQEQNIDVVVKIGRPNYQERKFIKSALAAGEPFPIKRVILKFKDTK